MRFRNTKGKIITDPKRKGFHKRDRWGFLKMPGELYRTFKSYWGSGRPGMQWAWRRRNAAWQKKRRLNYIAKLARRRNRGTK